MKKLKYGDRVTVYDIEDSDLDGKPTSHKTKGTVLGTAGFDNEIVIFQPDIVTANGNWFVHRRQCSKLRKKK